MKFTGTDKKFIKLAAAASAASLALVGSAFAQSNVGSNQVVISVAGSTALKNWFVAKTNTFTDIQPGTTLSINGTTYPLASDPSGGGTNYWSNGGISYQLAPKNNASVQGTGVADASPAIQMIYHESGSVEGILELANDQLYTNADFAGNSSIPETSIPYVTANIDRNPEGGNAVWLNYNQIGASGTTAGATFNATTGAAPSSTSVTLGNFYGTGVGQKTTPGETQLWTPGSASNPLPTFNTVNGVGVNASGGQNAVQVALSDAIPQQVFANNYGNQSNTYVAGGSTVTVTGSANSSFNSNPLDLGYGQGNTALAAASLGTAGSRAVYQSPSSLIPSATAQNPRAAAGTTFGVGPWNTNVADGGIGNLNSQLTAVTATAFVANPGTGLSAVNRTDADWLEMTSRLSNGASFNMTTRDVNSGTRDVSSLDTGVDPTYSTGKNDDGNGNLPNSASNSLFDQESVGPAQRFSNKTAGGAQLRPTVQNNRMAVGTLSINDAGSNDTQGNANPVRVLNYADTTTGYSNAVSPNFATISNGTYVIYQNEQVVTLKDMSSAAAYDNSYVATSSNGAAILNGTVQGDDSTGDVVTMLNNTANSVATAVKATTQANPADGLLSQGYIIPSLMQVSKNFNGQGLNNSVAGQIATGSIQSQSNLPANGGSFNQALYNTYSSSGGYGPTALPDLTSQEPTTGTGSTYGGKGATFATSGAILNGGAISITNNNYLFGNFNQNGDRDFNAVKSALSADEALISADQAIGASVPGSEFTSVGDNNLNWGGGTLVSGGTNGVSNTTPITYKDALGVTHTNLTKGDLIVMGDYSGDGHFDGADLVAMAEGASLSDSTSTDRLTASATMYQGGVLNKNAALDYLNANVGTTTAADQYIRASGRAILEGSSVPFGATAVVNPVSGTPVIDPVSGLAEFSYDPTGVNTFNKSDVNQDGVVDFNDAVLVDNENGQDYSNIADQVGATQPAPVSGTAIPFNLVMAKQSDGSTVINSSDVAVVSSALTGVGNTNWYNGVPLTKTGPSTITWARTGGTVTVYPGAQFNVNGGTVQIGGTEDPFTDNNAAGTGSTADNHVSVAINNGAKLQITQTLSTVSVAGLTINTASNSTLDLGTNAIIINYTPGNDPLSNIASYIASGYNGGGFNGTSGIVSSSVVAGTYGIGYADAADPGNPAGLAAGQIEVKYALLGDANLDGSVNSIDFAILATNFNKAVTPGSSSWDQGDFNYDGSVNSIDFADLAGNFNKGAASPGDLQALEAFASANGLLADVPEPATLSLLAVAGCGILGRRRRKA